METTTSYNCSQCGSPLILVSQVTEKLDGSQFPQTTANYRCSNQDCQDEKDRQTEKRMKLQRDKATADKKKADDKLRDKLAHLAASQDEKS